MHQRVKLCVLLRRFPAYPGRVPPCRTPDCLPWCRDALLPYGPCGLARLARSEAALRGLGRSSIVHPRPSNLHPLDSPQPRSFTRLRRIPVSLYVTRHPPNQARLWTTAAESGCRRCTAKSVLGCFPAWLVSTRSGGLRVWQAIYKA